MSLVDFMQNVVISLIVDEIGVASATDRFEMVAAVGVVDSKAILRWQRRLASIWRYENAQCDTWARSDSCIACCSSQWYTCKAFEHPSLPHLKYPPPNVHAFDDIWAHWGSCKPYRSLRWDIYKVYPDHHHMFDIMPRIWNSVNYHVLMWVRLRCSLMQARLVLRFLPYAGSDCDVVAVDVVEEEQEEEGS